MTPAPLEDSDDDVRLEDGDVAEGSSIDGEDRTPVPKRLPKQYVLYTIH